MVELHLSNPYAREAWRHTSVVAPVVDGVDRRLRGDGYRLAVEAVASLAGEGVVVTRTARRWIGALELTRVRTALVGRRVRRAARDPPANIRYLTGFTGSAAMLLVCPTTCSSSPTAATATRRREQLGAAGVDAEIAIGLTAGRATGCARGDGDVRDAARARGGRRHAGRSSARSPGSGSPSRARRHRGARRRSCGG